MEDTAFLTRLWTKAANHINRFIEIYAEGKPPRYPAIDSIAHDSHSRRLGFSIDVATNMLHEEDAEMKLFYEAPFSFAVMFLEMNWRDQTARTNPLLRHHRPEGQRRPSYHPHGRHRPRARPSKCAASAIFIDPHALHTSNNFRNAARMLFRAAVPLDKPVRILKRTNRFDLEAKLLIESLQFDAIEPLAPKTEKEPAL